MKLKLLVLSALMVAVGAFGQSAGKPEVVRILAVGNSFSEDALDYHFHGLCEAAGKRAVVGNLFIGGCSIDRHLLNARTDSAAYRFRRIGLDGAILAVEKVRLSEAIGSDDWDFVSFQQSSGVSGIYASYANLGELISYVDSLTPDKTGYIWHQTWAYAPTSTHSAFGRYGSDQQTMYDSIMNANRRAIMENRALSRVVPSGTAVQNAREAGGDPDLTRDGYHLHPLMGRYVAACAWFEAIFGESVVGNSYVPEGLSPEQARLAQESAHAACLSPFGERR